jgi:hypothetical protein
VSTSRCNDSCSFCSSRRRSRRESMDTSRRRSSSSSCVRSSSSGRAGSTTTPMSPMHRSHPHPDNCTHHGCSEPSREPKSRGATLTAGHDADTRLRHIRQQFRFCAHCWRNQGWDQLFESEGLNHDA